jgi:iron(III) transport system substrate-binding protein
MSSAVELHLPTGTGSKGTLVCYSSFESYELADYLAALAIVEPDIAIKIFRMPTAHLAAALISPNSLPAADMVFGWAATAATPEILARFVDHRYESPTGFSTAFCLDRPYLQRHALHEPRTWHDLASPELRGQLVMPDPRVSGAGFLAATTILQRYGAQQGWELLKAAFEGIRFVGSAWEPAAAMGAGNKALGVTVRIAAVQRAAQCADVAWCEPADAVGCEPEVYAIVNSCSDMAAAERVLEWITSNLAVPHYQRHAKVVFAIADSSGNRMPIDVERAIAGRPAFMSKWEASFG